MMKRNFSIIAFLFLAVFAGFNTVSATNSLSDGQGIDYYRSGFPAVAKPLLISSIATDSSKLAESCYYLGSLYFAENNVDSAAYYFVKGNAANPFNSLNTVGLNMIKMKSNLAEAEVNIANLLKLKQNKKNIDVYIAIANAYLANGILDKAVMYQEKAKDIKSKYAPVYVLLGDIEVAKKNAGEACRNYEQAIYFDNKCKEAYIKYARAYKSVNSSLAIEKLNALKAAEPTFLLADRELADTYFSINNFAKAAESYEVYLKSGNSSVIDLTKYAFILFLNGQFDKSLDVTKIGLTKEPLNPVFNRLLMYNNVDLKRATEALSAADVFFNKSLKPEFTYLDYRYYGQALRDNKQIVAAIPQFEKALQMDSSKTDLWKDISDMYSEKNMYTKALDAYNSYMKALAQDKVTGDVLMTLGKLYYGLSNDSLQSVTDKKGFCVKADSVFALVAAKEPTGYRGNFWRARANIGLDPETTLGLAKPYYEQTATLVISKADAKFNPVLIECYRYLAFYYFQKKDYNEAQSTCNKILAIDANNSVAKTLLDGIKKMKR